MTYDLSVKVGAYRSGSQTYSEINTEGFRCGSPVAFRVAGK